VDGQYRIEPEYIAFADKFTGELVLRFSSVSLMTVSPNKPAMVEIYGKCYWLYSNRCIKDIGEFFPSVSNSLGIQEFFTLQKKVESVVSTYKNTTIKKISIKVPEEATEFNPRIDDLLRLGILDNVVNFFEDGITFEELLGLPDSSYKRITEIGELGIKFTYGNRVVGIQQLIGSEDSGCIPVRTLLSLEEEEYSLLKSRLERAKK
jgi:hypothetical protein